MSVYIDPKMTGEGGEDAMSRSSAKKKDKQPKAKPKDLESEDSVLSGMEKPVSEGEEGNEGENGEEENEADDEEEEEEEMEGRPKLKKKPSKALASLDRNKFGRYIVSYGKTQCFQGFFN